MIVKFQMNTFKLFWVLSRPTPPNYLLNLICYKHFMAVFDPLGRHKKKKIFGKTPKGGGGGSRPIQNFLIRKK